MVWSEIDGESTKMIDEIPFKECDGDAVVPDFTGKELRVERE